MGAYTKQLHRRLGEAWIVRREEKHPQRAARRRADRQRKAEQKRAAA